MEMWITKNKDGTFTVKIEGESYGNFGVYETFQDEVTLGQLMQMRIEIDKALSPKVKFEENE